MAYKIVETKEFKEQKSKFSKKDQDMINKEIQKIAKDPTNLEYSMGLFTPPSPEELANWMHGTKAEKIDLVLEYLRDKECLNRKGKKLAKDFWEKYIKEV